MLFGGFNFVFEDYDYCNYCLYMRMYQEIYLLELLMWFGDQVWLCVVDLLLFEYFEVEFVMMLIEVFVQYYILINFKDILYCVENWCGGDYCDFMFYKNEIVVIFVGLKSGWWWYV